MKNVLVISTEKEELLSNVNDGTNTLYINGSVIPSTDWTGTGNYTATVEGHAITIAKVDDTSGNITLEKVSGYNYKLKKLSTGGGGAIVTTEGTYCFDVNNEGHLILYYTGTTAPDFQIDSNGHLILTIEG